MLPGDKVEHCYWGKCEVVDPGTEQTLVKLASEVNQVVSTGFLKPDGAEKYPFQSQPEKP